MLLTREFRLRLVADTSSYDQPKSNSWSGWPTSALLAPQLLLRASVLRQPDPVSGFIYNITTIDKALQQTAKSLALHPVQTGEALVLACWNELRNSPFGDDLAILSLCSTPYLRYELRRDDFPMVRITQQFEFSASHRLHVASLSDEANRELFGKCNNPHGHGHNYVLDVSIAGGTDAATPMSIGELDQRVKEVIIDRLDHRNLNVEIEEFRDLNPTVENIAQVIWDKLDAALRPAVLDHIRLYETPKTWVDLNRGDAR